MAGRIAGAFFVLAILAAGCVGVRSEPPLRQVAVAVRAMGSLDPLAVSLGEESKGSALAVRQIYEGLTDYDPATLRVRPALASDWTVDPAGREYVFRLRKARFHDGTPVRSSDVVFSLTRLAAAVCEPASSAIAGAPSYLLEAVQGASRVCERSSLAGVRAAGPETVLITLTEPWADFPSALANPAASIVPRLRAAQLGRAPVGTGPYMVRSQWNGRRLTLSAFPRYWGRRASLGLLAFVAYGSDDAGYVDLLQRRVAVASVPPPRFGQARRRFGEAGLRRIAGSYFFAFNLKAPRMAQAGLRAAIVRAVDRASLATAVFEQTREPARGIAPPEVPGADGASCLPGCVRSLREARALVAQARPEGAPEITIGVSSLGANPEVAQALARMLASAGISARVVERSLRDHVRGIQDADTDLFQLGWVPAYPSFDALLVPMFKTGGRENRMGYSNPAVDAVLARARATQDAGSRAKMFASAERMVVADNAVLPLLWYRSSYAFDPRIRRRSGPKVDGMGLIRFADLRS